jgi:4-amino-4-deoxy-L-arabinose transferase-like glycosyltransferase
VQGASLLRLEWVLVGTISIAVAGWILVWRKYPHPLTPSPLHGEGEKTKEPLAFDEKLLIFLIIVALVIRWLGVAYWPSTAYDALWVYAYEGKLYTLLGYIPQTIGYYPQFLPLQHTYLQLAVGGVDDHAARAVIPWLHVGCILAVYVLGNRLFERRTGIIAAAIWGLYVHVGEWSRYGDLEVPVTFMFTAAAAFFVMAWRTSPPNSLSINREGAYRRRYALIAGIFLSIGMWTKPTMGAFIYGIGLMGLIELVRQWRSSSNLEPLIQRIRPHIEVLLITGLASIPLGAVWYIRNLLLGHAAITLPDGYWQTLAARSGSEFGWPLLAVLVLSGRVIWQWQGERRLGVQAAAPLRIRWMITGLALILIGLLPSIYNNGRIGITENRIGLAEWLALVAGAFILFRSFWNYAKSRWTEPGKQIAITIGWLMVLALPYFVTWFYSYSYSYRLSFAIVPLMIMPTAVILSQLKLNGHDVVGTGRALSLQKTAYVIIIALSIPGIITPLYDINAGWDWLWTNKLPDDTVRYRSGNAALMAVVDGLQVYREENPDKPLQVVAPGIGRLPFFFPLDDIRTDQHPTRLNELEGVTYYIYGKPESGGELSAYMRGTNQVIDALSLATDDPTDTRTPIRRAWWSDDGIFKYTVYEIHLENRLRESFINARVSEGQVIFGGFARLLGHDIGDLSFWPGRKLIMHLYWQVVEQPQADYTMYIHLRDKAGNLQATWDGPVSWTNDGNYYSTLVWEPGEYMVDQRQLVFDNLDAPLGDGYRIYIGMYNSVTQERVPITINGAVIGDGYPLLGELSIVAPPPQ